ncbi:MAG: helix-turn-helix domain-containing protein [bacterium]|nr:helix-turn-helix domain-containing protein [bacterium]
MKIRNAIRCKALFFVCSFLLFSKAYSKDFTILVTSAPNVKSNESIFIAANINDWDPFNSKYQLTRTENGYHLNISTKEEYLQFKFTRGSWGTVEGDELGHRIDNRLLSVKEIKDTVHFNILGWEDIKPNGAIHLQIIDRSFGSIHNDSLFVTGNFNGWNPGEQTYQLQNTESNIYEVEIPYSGKILEYKYTRGSWNTVEGNEAGEIRNNRILVPPYKEIHIDTILTWEDLGTNRRYQFFIEKVPKRTPHDASIYVTGNFNDWDPKDDRYIMTLGEDQTYYINIESELDTLIYKFTRGDFNSVEGRYNGLARPNRIAIYDQQDFPVITEVLSWEDLNGDWFNVYAITLIVPSIIGVLIFFALGGLQNSRPANETLRWLVLILSISLILRIIPFYREVFKLFPHVILFADVIYFLFPVLLYLYFRKLFGLRSQLSPTIISMHFLPITVLVILYLPLFLTSRDAFINEVMDQDNQVLFRFVGFGGLVFSFVYWYLKVSIQRKYVLKMEENLSFDVNLRYTRSIILIGGTLLFFWVSIYIIGLVNEIFNLDILNVAEALTDVSWLMFSGYIYLFGFFAIQRPELFLINSSDELAVKTSLVDGSEITRLMSRLDLYMSEQKPYLNDQLSLSQLASNLNLTDHTLSKVINEGFSINFYELINRYRVQEFIEIASDPRNANKTFMGLAYEVGFNSKSTFNRSFKKEKGCTPREFFKQSNSTNVVG